MLIEMTQLNTQDQQVHKEASCFSVGYLDAESAECLDVEGARYFDALSVEYSDAEEGRYSNAEEVVSFNTDWVAC